MTIKKVNRYTHYQYARTILEISFDLPLSLGDRMILRQIVEQAQKDKDRIEKRISRDQFRVPHESAMRYLIKYHGMKASNEMMDAVMGYVSREYKREVRDRALYWE